MMSVSYVNKKYIAKKIAEPEWPPASNWDPERAMGLDSVSTDAVSGWHDIRTFNAKRKGCCDNPRG